MNPSSFPKQQIDSKRKDRKDWAHVATGTTTRAKVSALKRPQNQSKRNTDGFCHRFTKELEATVAEPACAIRYTVIALLGLVAAYWILHVTINHWRPGSDWSQVLSTSRNSINPPEATRGGVTVFGDKETGIAPDGTFAFNFRDDILNRYFARDKINEWKQQQEEKGHRRSLEALGQRRGPILAAAVLVFSTFDRSLALTFFPKDPNSSTPEGAITDADYLRIILPDSIAWLKRELNGRSPSFIPPEKRVIVESIISSLEAQDLRETKSRRDLAEQVTGMKPVLSFDWMLIDDARWIFEVIFWCLFGVLAKTLIRLIAVGRLSDNDPKAYNPTEFLLFIPKAVLAPLLAVVVVSWWATGYSEAKINFANLPYLLVFFFSLGFMTESIYSKLADLGQLIVGQSVAASEAKMSAASQQAIYQFRSPAVDTGSTATGPVNTISQLADAAKAVTASALERGIVTRQVQKASGT